MSPIPVRDLVTVAEEERIGMRPEPQPTHGPDSLVLMFERLATNKDVDVEKLQKLIDMQERILAHNARSAFNAAFAQMQAEMPEISERGQIIVKGTVRSTYATLEDIHQVIKPILKAHGFAIRHRTEWPQDRAGIIRIVGILSHHEGHAEESTFEAAADKSDYRTDIQSMGSTVSYGRRYTTLDLLNIATRGADKDGQAQQKSETPAPAGFEEWWLDMQAVADEGLGKLSATWNKSKGEYRAYLVGTNKQGWEALKVKAGKVGR